MKKIIYSFFIFLVFAIFPYSGYAEDIFSFDDFYSDLYSGGEYSLADDISYSGGHGENYLTFSNAFSISGNGFSIDGNNVGMNIQLKTGTEKSLDGITLHNSSSTFGGAIYNYSLSSLSVANSSFEDNYAEAYLSASGGAIYNAGIVAISSSSFEHNVSSTTSGSPAEAFGASGGALYNTATAYLVNAVFNENSSSENGGAASNWANAVLNIENSTFTANNAGRYGGALFNSGTVRFSGDNYFYGNSSVQSGDDVYNSGIMEFIGGKTIFSGGIEGSGGVSISGGAELVMENSVFSQGSLDIESGSSFYIDPANFRITWMNVVENDGIIYFSTSSYAELAASFSGNGTIILSSGSLGSDCVLNQGHLSILEENSVFENKGSVNAEIVSADGTSLLYDAEDGENIAGGNAGFYGNSSIGGTISQHSVSVAQGATLASGGIFAAEFANYGTADATTINVSESLINGENASITGTVRLSSAAAMTGYDGSAAAEIFNSGIISLNPGNDGIFMGSISSGTRTGILRITGDMSEDFITDSKTAYFSGAISGQNIYVSSSVMKLESDGSINASSLTMGYASSLDLRNSNIDSVSLGNFTVSADSVLKIDVAFSGGNAESDSFSVSGNIDSAGGIRLGAVNVLADDWLEISQTASLRLFSSSQGNLANLNITGTNSSTSEGDYTFYQSNEDGGLIIAVKTGDGKTLEEAFSAQDLDSYSMKRDAELEEDLVLSGNNRNLTVFGNGYGIDASSMSAVEIGIQQSVSFENMGEIRNFSTSSDELSGGFLVNRGNVYISSATIRDNNNALYGGGAIYNADSGHITLDEVSFEENYSGDVLIDIYNDGIIEADSVSLDGGIAGNGEFSLTGGTLSVNGRITQSTITVHSGASLSSLAGGLQANALVNDGTVSIRNGGSGTLDSAVYGSGTLNFVQTSTAAKAITQGNVNIAENITLYAEGNINAAIYNSGNLVYKADTLPSETTITGDGNMYVRGNVAAHGTISQKHVSIEKGYSLAVHGGTQIESRVSASDGITNDGTLSFDGISQNNNSIDGTWQYYHSPSGQLLYRAHDGILSNSGTLYNYGNVSKQYMLQNTGTLNVYANMDFALADNSGQINISSNAVFSVNDTYIYRYSQNSDSYSAEPYNASFGISSGAGISLRDSAEFRKLLDTFSVFGGILEMYDNSRLNVNDFNMGGGNAEIRGNAIINASGIMNFSGGNIAFYGNSRAVADNMYITGGRLSLYGNSAVSSSGNIILSGGTLYASDSSSVSSLDINGGTLELSSQLNVSGNVNISNGGIIRSDVYSSSEYGKLHASGNISSQNEGNSGPILMAVMKNDFMDRGETINLEILNASGNLNVSFPVLTAGMGYELADAGNGSYSLTYTGTVDNEVFRAGGNSNNAAAGNAWLGYSPQPGSEAQQMKEKLDEAYALSPENYVNMLTALAPESTPAATEIAAGINAAAYDAAAARLASLEGMASGDYFSDLGVWGNLVYSRNEFSKGTGYNAYTAGMAIGADSEFFGSLFRAGIGYSYSSTSMDSKFRETDIRTNTLFLYGQYVSEYFSYRAMASYGKSDYSEQVSAPGIYGENEYSAGTFGLEFMAEYCPEYLDLGDYEWIKNFAPSAGIRILSTERESYQDKLGQDIGSSDSSVMTALLGISWKHSYYSSGNVFKPELHLGTSFDIISPDNRVSVSLPGGVSYNVNIEKMPKASFDLGGTAALVMEDGVELGLSYSSRFNSAQSTHLLQVIGKYKF